MVTDKTRRSAFIEQNLGLVHSCAGRFRGRGIEYDDLYSAGCMGLEGVMGKIPATSVNA